MHKIEHLNEEDLARIDAHRTWVEGWIVEGRAHVFQAAEGKLKLIQNILDSGELAPTDTTKLQALGTYFGLAISEYTGWPIVAYEDEHGRDPAILHPGKSAYIFPMTMISKRVEKGESVNAFFLFSQIIPKLKQVADESANLRLPDK